MVSTVIVIVLSIFPAAAAILEIIKFFRSLSATNLWIKNSNDDRKSLNIIGSKKISVNPFLLLCLLITILSLGVLLIQNRIDGTARNFREEALKMKLIDIEKDIEMIKAENSIVIRDEIDLLLKE